MAGFAEGRLNGDYGEQLLALAQRLESDHLAQLVIDNVDCEPNRAHCKTWIRIGKKYDKIDIGGSGKLMVVRATGEIFGIKGYGVIHKGHPYGTLDTIGKWYWGRYYPARLSAQPVENVVPVKST